MFQCLLDPTCFITHVGVKTWAWNLKFKLKTVAVGYINQVEAGHQHSFYHTEPLDFLFIENTLTPKQAKLQRGRLQRKLWSRESTIVDPDSDPWWTLYFR